MGKGLIEIDYRVGTLVLEQVDKDLAAGLPHVMWDERTSQFRAPGYAYRDLVLKLMGDKIPFRDQARRYQTTELRLAQPITPREHQVEGLRAWNQAQKRGTVSLPTGAGKTILAVLAITMAQRSTLVVVPTIDLMEQWEVVMRRYFDQEVGMIGGGRHEIRPLTVSTYDSAAIHIERLGDKFGLIVFDECHHLPAPQYQTIALGAIAPFRLGLSATVARTDGRESIVFDLVGPLVYEAKIRDMLSTTLSPYEVVTIEVPMSDEERLAYQEAREIYTGFLRVEKIRMDSRTGWMDFVMRSSRTPSGRAAMRAYWNQKRLAQASDGKLRELWNIFEKHKSERILVFTDDNALAYRIGREFFVPVLTHKTRPVERKRMLDEFRKGGITILATSKVLNEGVDVPEASVGIVLSGSGAVREHVQRLGRILRKKEGKRATMYELVSKGTSEQYVNRRRKQHDAYERSP
jgi:superfamily II DNA or RNA helicase